MQKWDAPVPVCLEGMPCLPPMRPPDTAIEIQSPIEGFIFYNDTPQVIRWIAVPGVTSYSVSIREANKNIWETIVHSIEILHPTDLRLKPGNSYELTVQVVGDERKTNLTFRMLSEEETQDILSQANNILINPDLSEVEKALKVASFYSENLLFKEAMEVLFNAVETHQNSAPVYRKLGDLLLNTRQPTLARTHYQQSFNLATNSEEKAYATYGLGMVSVYERNLEEATQWLSLAQSHYEQTGAQDLVEKIAELLVGIGAGEE